MRETNEHSTRLWPGVLAVVLQWLGMYVIPFFVPDFKMYGVMGAFACAFAILVWWVLFSRAPLLERLGGPVLVVLAMVGTPYLLHESVAQGNMGFQFYLYAIPFLSLTFVVWAVASRHLPGALRWVSMAAAIALGCGVWTLVRSVGLTGDGMPEFAWRWKATAEERLLAAEDVLPEVNAVDRVEDVPVHVAESIEDTAPVVDADLAPPMHPVAEGAEWPGYRGPGRNGVLPGVRIETDWAQSPPVELWRRPVGPGVSSFAIRGNRVYTQEQRGEDEVVACYDLTTGEPIWGHRDRARYWDSHVGVGPRATPTLSGDRVYTFGATGILNALDADDGRVIWSQNVTSDTEARIPYFGFVSSPLVVDDLVVVHAEALVAYDLATGERRWLGPARRESYGSPHLLTLDGVEQVVLLGEGALGVDPSDGTLLWEHQWTGMGIVQPVVTADGDLLFSLIDHNAVPIGTRRLTVAHDTGGWTVEERWTSNRLKPSFSPFVIHGGYAYGFDGRIMSCIDVAEGKRQWKGGRYGSGQVLLLPDQALLVVVTEHGDLALVSADPDGFNELARVPALEAKTWNQPALVDDILLVRNGEEMAAFRLSRPTT